MSAAFCPRGSRLLPFERGSQLSLTYRLSQRNREESDRYCLQDQDYHHIELVSCRLLRDRLSLHKKLEFTHTYPNDSAGNPALIRTLQVLVCLPCMNKRGEFD